MGITLYWMWGNIITGTNEKLVEKANTNLCSLVNNSCLLVHTWTCCHAMKDKNLAVPPSTLALHTYLKLVVELGHNEESPPAPQLLWLEHVSEDVVAHIQNIPAKLSGGSAILEMEHLPLAPISLERTSELPPLYTAESSKVPLWDPMLRRPVSLFTWRQWVECIDKSMNDQVQSPSTLCRSSPSLLVAANLTQHCALGKKAWFSGVNKGEIEVRLPGTSSVWGIREIQQVVHHLVHQSKFILSRSDCDTSGFKSPLLCTAPDWYTPSRCW